MIVAPNYIRANELVQVTVSIFRLLYEQLTIRLSIKIGDDEIISAKEVFKSPGTRLMQLQISKPIYHQSQTVRFRVIPVRPDLTPSYGSLVSIEVIDASGNVFRRWLNPMTNTGGIIELDFPLSDMIHEGIWKIRAQHERFSVEKTFRVVEYWRPLWDVNVTLPLRMTDNQLALVGLVSANYTSGKAVFGNATVLIELRDRSTQQGTQLPRARITKELRALDGFGSFLVTLAELQAAAGSQGASTSLANTEVWVNVTFYSWWEKNARQGWAYTTIFSANPQVKFLGGMVRPFKPDLYFTVYMVVFMPDGSKVRFMGNRKISLSFYCNENTFENKVFLVVPDDGVITYTYRPSGENCITHRLQALYLDESDRVLSSAIQRIFRYPSYSGAFMQLSSPTMYSSVNDYMVINVQTNYPTDTIHYLIIANGNILTADKLKMPNSVTSRTFSVAVSRAMFPISHIVAYFLKDDSEIVSDALTFYTNYTNLNNVYMEVNRGKDLNQDTVEIKGFATPGSYLAFNVIHEELYKFGVASFLLEHVIVDELATYDSHSQSPFEHTWYETPMDIERVYLPAPSYGADTNSTMNVSGLTLFTDANFTKANFYHTCNETLNPARALPCFSMTGRDCYSRAERCNGIAECVTWVDEMNCPTNDSYIANPFLRLENYNMIFRLWDDGNWLWHSTFVKPDGQIQFQVNLPKINAEWIAGAFSIDRDNGISLMQRAHPFSGTRRFYMTVEAPEEAVWGEQIGVRACIFNNWDYWIETLVEIKASPDVRVVHVGFGGRVSAYSPETTDNQTLQTLAFIEAGTSRYVYMPVLPKEPGNTSYTICAYSFIGSNCETRTIRVSMNGITNHYHTATFLDLTSSSVLFVNNFKVIVPQKYTIPERRMHRFVPGSQGASLSVVEMMSRMRRLTTLIGMILRRDFIGPALSEHYRFADTQNVLRLRYGAAENVFFELGYNLNLLIYLYGDGYLPQTVLREGLLHCTVVLQKGFAFFNSNVGAFANFRDELHK